MMENPATSGEKLSCKAVTKAGRPCQSWPVAGTDFCALHGPNAAEIQRKGGLHKSLQHRIEQRMSSDLQGVMQLLIKALDEVHGGDLTPGQGSALASLGASILKVREQAILEERVRALEAKIMKGDTR